MAEPGAAHSARPAERIICALGTALGAVPVLVIRRMPVALSDTLLGFELG